MNNNIHCFQLCFLLLQPPGIDNCYMLAIKHYDVRINSSKGEVLSEKIDITTVIFDYLDNQSTITINITVIDIKGQRSIPTITETTIGIQNITISSKQLYM